MIGIDPTTWTLLSPLLDEALDLPAAERARSLARLEGERPNWPRCSPACWPRTTRRWRPPSSTNRWRPPATLAGMRVGAYMLERPLGAAAWGAVWLARREDGRFEGPPRSSSCT